jgi:hypothetical protein
LGLGAISSDDDPNANSQEE